MATDFGAPVYEQSDPNKEHPANGQSSTEQLAAAIDPNDPRLISEALDDRLDADAYAVPPPPPDGKWKAKLKLAKIKGDDGQQHDFILTSRQGIDDGKPFYAVNVESSLIDFSGRFDNVKVTEYWVKSLIDAKKGTSQMTTLCVKAGSPPPRARRRRTASTISSRCCRASRKSSSRPTGRRGARRASRRRINAASASRTRSCAASSASR